jgi:ABC-type antimicrobial peptide transport system permease subunit
MAQESSRYSRLAVRTAGVPPETVLAPIQQAIASLDPDLPVSDLMTAEQRFARTASDLSFINILLGAFAVLALGLAALGIYGAIARTVAQRTGEFGIRLALGAQVHDVTGLVLTAGARLALIGAGLGFLGALGLTRVLASGMPGLQTSHGVMLGGVAVVLIATALFASYLPARRAARINPVGALRAE